LRRSNRWTVVVVVVVVIEDEVDTWRDRARRLG
jgi:hypothetical protein